MFTLKPEEVDFEKIESFCKEKIPEGETVEYKRAFPSDPAKLAKGISAMANTHGGIILIGVKANETTNTPIMPIQGIKLTEGLEEKITSICLRNIYQPYFPSVKICDFKNKRGENRTVVFIRVYESDQTPHAINNNTDVYLRIRSQNEPFRKATVDEIEWLRGRREKAIQLRDGMIQRADERHEALSAAVLDQTRRHHCRKVFLVPLYPSYQLTSPFRLCEFLDKLEGLGGDRNSGIVAGLVKTAADTLYYFDRRSAEPESRRWVSYGELTSHGLVLLKESWWEDCYPSSQVHFDVLYFLQLVYQALKHGSDFYLATGFQGLVKVGVCVDGLRGKHIGCAQHPKYSEIVEFLHNQLDDSYIYKKSILASDLAQNLEPLVLEVYKEFLFACGFGKDVKRLEKTAAKHWELVKRRHNM